MAQYFSRSEFIGKFKNIDLSKNELIFPGSVKTMGDAIEYLVIKSFNKRFEESIKITSKNE